MTTIVSLPPPPSPQPPPPPPSSLQSPPPLSSSSTRKEAGLGCSTGNFEVILRSCPGEPFRAIDTEECHAPEGLGGSSGWHTAGASQLLSSRRWTAKGGETREQAFPSSGDWKPVTRPRAPTWGRHQQASLPHRLMWRSSREWIERTWLILTALPSSTDSFQLQGPGTKGTPFQWLPHPNTCRLPSVTGPGSAPIQKGYLEPKAASAQYPQASLPPFCASPHHRSYAHGHSHGFLGDIFSTQSLPAAKESFKWKSGQAGETLVIKRLLLF